jgi:hypothetical protein
MNEYELTLKFQLADPQVDLDRDANGGLKRSNIMSLPTLRSRNRPCVKTRSVE